jgi:hypothetical protein
MFLFLRADSYACFLFVSITGSRKLKVLYRAMYDLQDPRQDRAVS